MKYNPKLPDESVNVTQNNFVVEAFKLIAGLLVIIALAYLLLITVISFGIDNISIETEKKIQALFSKKIDDQKSDIRTQEIQLIVDNLNKCVKLPYDIKVTISDSTEVNAMAMIGGNIIITEGMLKEIKNENELTFVLGHEMGHFKHRDHLKGISSAIVLTTLAAFIESSSSQIINQLVEIERMEYSQTQEIDADTYGVDMLMCRYQTTVGASNLFSRMIKDDNWSNFLLTHPNFKERVEKIDKYIKNNNLSREGETIPK